MKNAKIIDKIKLDLLQQDIFNIKDFMLFYRKQFTVYRVESKYIPNILKEIGRLREKTFREVGEGTGKAIDLDEYDNHYRQLFIWDTEKLQIVGGYRVGLGDKIFKKIGTNGFYINSLFFVKEEFHHIMKSSIELGRSFVVKEYQKDRLPLFLLWKGIFEFIKTNTKYKYVYGPLSISKYYSKTSKTVIMLFIKFYFYDNEMAKLLSPKTPFENEELNSDIIDFFSKTKGKLNELDEFIKIINPLQLKLPVLMRQYLKQNAKFIGFNLDPNFSDALDGFVVLDVSKLPKETIEFLS